MEQQENNKSNKDPETLCEVQGEEKIEFKAEEIDFKAKYFYLAAEMDNMRKRFEREKENMLKYGNERILGELIEVVDNFDRTVLMLKADPDQTEKLKNIIQGIDMVGNQFLSILGKFGLKKVETHGKNFDPNFHEAMAQEEVAGKNEGEIIKEYQTGYLLSDRLLRAAKVVVNKKKN
ncbi:MAG: nucleotide exchange factor GrpE [Bacteriovoracaceae bacterium]|nr:nucleotide exchange factor GrpE [Bacteriovoracaceae bacterium]